MRQLPVWAAAITLMLSAAAHAQATGATAPDAVSAAGVAGPTISAARLLSRSVNVQTAPAAPEMSINYSAPAGVSSIIITFISAHQQTYEEYVNFSAPTAKAGTLVIRDVMHPMSLYAEPGVWAVEDIAITDFANKSAGYSGTPLIFILPNPSVRVVNAGTVDIGQPSVTAGSLLTRSVSRSSSSHFFEAQLTVADFGSGVIAAYIDLQPPKGATQIRAVSFPSGPITAKGNTIVGVDMSPYPTLLGTWTIVDYEACDAAANCFLDNNVSDITKLFGRRTFTLVK